MEYRSSASPSTVMTKDLANVVSSPPNGGYGCFEAHDELAWVCFLLYLGKVMGL
jgi:hypothetical protein